MEPFESLVRHIFSSITAADSQPEITFTPTEGGLLLITVATPTDKVGQLIGKEGKIIKSIRTILNLSFPTVKYQIDFSTPLAPAEFDPTSEVKE